jgi:hypothetical protein
LVVKGRHLGDPWRDGEILEVRHADGTPPYVVRWADTGRTSLFFPGADTSVQHFTHDRTAAAEKQP